jgi:hypothetical protein
MKRDRNAIAGGFLVDAECDEATGQCVLPRNGLVVVDRREFALFEDLAVDLGQTQTEHASPLDQHSLDWARVRSNVFEQLVTHRLQQLSRLGAEIDLRQHMRA